ncbi:hypothetical protein BHE18_20675 [Rossellomorea aquimaris]|uniref:Uncharacterized protein n=1 Tax=Rossellomorea aquimaris TaxID=189382 RepID=A0A1J6VZZ6_9BACI|nr:hypothetical protein BHE18_20675 [Rossellomorea aquimaris]
MIHKPGAQMAPGFIIWRFVGGGPWIKSEVPGPGANPAGRTGYNPSHLSQAQFPLFEPGSISNHPVLCPAMTTIEGQKKHRKNNSCPVRSKGVKFFWDSK